MWYFDVCDKMMKFLCGFMFGIYDFINNFASFFRKIRLVYKILNMR